MMPVRIIADDLTGALDSAGSFASMAGPMHVLLDLSDGLDASASFAIDTETRNAPMAWAVKRIEAIRDVVYAEGCLCFKKLDSLLRGNPAAEIVACAERFASVVIAPALPAQNRITRGGRQLFRDGPGEDWRPVEYELGPALRAHGVAVHCRETAADGVHLLDAESDDDLLTIVAGAGSLPQPVLWCGSAGLAGALAGHPPPRARRTNGHPVLLLLGSLATATGRQIAAMRDSDPAAVVAAAQAGRNPAATCRAVGRRLESGRSAAILLTPRRKVAVDKARCLMAEVLENLAKSLPPPPTVLVSGGETAFALCQALGANRLEVLGNLRTGIPVSRFVDGLWAGSTLISKGGSFGGPDTLVELTDVTRETVLGDA